MNTVYTLSCYEHDGLPVDESSTQYVTELKNIPELAISFYNEIFVKIPGPDLIVKNQDDWEDHWTITVGYAHTTDYDHTFTITPLEELGSE